MVASEQAASPPRGRGRPRNPRADAQVLEAALAEYADRGWSGFTMDGVARRAGVGKSTLYLRWSDKDSLLLDAVTARSMSIWTVDTGSLRGDLEAIAGNLFRHYQDPSGWASLRLAVDATVMDSPWRANSETLSWRHLEGIGVLLERAVARGELSDVDHREMVFCLCGSVTMQALMRAGGGRPMSEEEVSARTARVVDFALRGAAGTGPD